MKIIILNLDRTPDDVVITAHWMAELTENGVTVSNSGSEKLGQKSASDPDFIPFEELTEETVIGWVKEKIGEDVKRNLEAQIVAKTAAPIISGLPWAS
jgi:hypothetical protein